MLRGRTRVDAPLVLLAIALLIAGAWPAAAYSRNFACLVRRGQLITLNGTLTTPFHEDALAVGTRIDARTAVFLASPQDRYPIAFNGGRRLCLAGGAVRGQYDRKLTWSQMHDMNNAAVAIESPTTVDGIRIDNVTDGIRPEGIGPFTIRHAHLSYVRDDCVENDHLESGSIEDSLFDGCYVGLSERPTQAILDQGVDGRRLTVTIRKSLIRLQPMPGARNGGRTTLGNGGFFKWHELATRLSLYDNIFMAEKVSQDGPSNMGIPASLIGCRNNVMVWLGPGNYPAPLPPCFRVTTDRTVWDNAVARWKRLHPDVAN